LKEAEKAKKGSVVVVVVGRSVGDVHHQYGVG